MPIGRGGLPFSPFEDGLERLRYPIYRSRLSRVEVSLRTGDGEGEGQESRSQPGSPEETEYGNEDLDRRRDGVMVTGTL